MKTKEAATKAWKKLYLGAHGYVFQFPEGHWGYCSENSPIGASLRNSGNIYTGVHAMTWEVIA